MDAITDDDEDTIPSFDSDTAGASCETNDDIAASIHVIGCCYFINEYSLLSADDTTGVKLSPCIEEEKGNEEKM
jgi:hypothetical protein